MSAHIQKIYLFLFSGFVWVFHLSGSKNEVHISKTFIINIIYCIIHAGLGHVVGIKIGPFCIVKNVAIFQHKARVVLSISFLSLVLKERCAVKVSELVLLGPVPAK